MKSNRRTFLRVGLGIGALLCCAPLLGMFGSMIGMARAFTTLGQSGIGDPQRLSGAVAETLFITATGLALFPVGLALLTVCGVLLRRSHGTTPPPLPRFPENTSGPSDNR